MISPSVGRVVWYWPNGTGADAQPWAAMVSKVHSDRSINIGGFDPSGQPFARTSVPLLQDDEGSIDACASWMPYQKGQAAKTEALEKELAK